MIITQIILIIYLLATPILSAATCERTEILFEKSFEPSDVVWDSSRECLWIVSDEGVLARMSVHGQNITYWNVPSFPDLEGLMMIPNRKDYLYLQSESAELIEYHILNESVSRTFELAGSKLESIVWVEASNVFFSGEQKTGDIYQYTFDAESGMVTQVDKFTLPAPNPGDLSTMHYEIVDGREHLLAVYDKHQILVSYTRPPGELNNTMWSMEKQWKIEDLGTEGITWAKYNGSTYFFTCVDVKQGARKVMRYATDQLDLCLLVNTLSFDPPSIPLSFASSSIPAVFAVLVIAIAVIII